MASNFPDDDFNPPDDDDGFSRRVFLHRLTFFGGGVVLLGGGIAACKKTESPATGVTSAAVTTSAHKSFTNEEFLVISAVVDRFLPKDEDAGGVEANVPQYIDAILQTPELQAMRENIVKGTNALDRRSTKEHGKPFPELTPAQKDKLLTTFKNMPYASGEAHYYEQLMALTLEGFLGDPSYGGNKDHVGWSLIGFGTSEPPPNYNGMKMLHSAHGGH